MSAGEGEAGVRLDQSKAPLVTHSRHKLRRTVAAPQFACIFTLPATRSMAAGVSSLLMVPLLAARYSKLASLFDNPRPVR